MASEIKNIHLQFACQENWNAMAETNGGRHCDKCNKKVYDFTDSKVDEFRKILAENGNSVCGRFKTEQAILKHFPLPFWKKWVSAAMLLVGFNLLSKNEALAQAPNIDSTAIDTTKGYMLGEPVMFVPQKEQKFSKSHIYTTVEQMPEFTGGVDTLMAYINKTIRYPADARKNNITGRVWVSFVVERNGSVSDAKVTRGITEFNIEAVRVVNTTSNKWQPGKQNGKTVRVQYTVPVIFE